MPARKPDPEKYCAYARCPKRLVRGRSPAGRLEDAGDFRRRKYCDNVCKGKANMKPVTNKVGRQGELAHGQRGCIQCGELLVRKQRPCGAWEPRHEFKKRRWCSVECRNLWRAEDPTRTTTRGEKHAAAIKSSPKFRAWLRKHGHVLELAPTPVPRKDRRRTIDRVCMHGAAAVLDCVFCTRLQTDAKLSDRVLLRPREEWITIGCWQVEDELWEETA